MNIEMQGVLTARTVREYQRQAEGGDLYRGLSAAFRSVVPMERAAVAQFLDGVYAFAAAILAAPADYPARLVDYAHGLLNESVDLVQASTRGVP